MNVNTYSIPTVSRYLFDADSPFTGLERLATNLYWTWHPEVQALFRSIDPEMWDRGAGPVGILRRSPLADIVPTEPDFGDRLGDIVGAFDAYLAGAGTAWHARQDRPPMEGPIAYFCAEYGFHESLNLYAGGLGILAGDHLKEASDMGLPLVAVGLFYRRGFFHQLIDWEGRQEHLYPRLVPEMCPLQRVARPGTDEPLTIEVPMPGRRVSAAVWLAQVGRVPLLLLDTDVEGNAPEDRPITSQLYTNGREMRLCQETVLGVGGVRALRALGIDPSVWHLNEGHSAFLLLERLRERLAGGEGVEAARANVRAGSVITIHTPVPEGNERFGADLASELISPILEGTALGAPEVLALGLGADADPGVFDMTAFALRHCRAANGVSALHGRTADATWRGIAGYEVTGVTNGIHLPTWIGPRMKGVYARYGATSATETAVEGTESGSRARWDGILGADARELWEAHLAQKAALVEFAKARLLVQHARHGEGPAELRRLVEALDPDAMIIGFARRFATYKRASLIFSDPDRLEKLLTADGRPVQILFAGKSHPSDRGGQALIQEVYALTQSPRFKGRAFLLEDYDIEVARYLVQGVDVWLNNPRRPLEASGTSGMKAAANGVPNISILDGWWDEAYEGGRDRNGWAIGDREPLDDPAVQDREDAQSLYRLLESEVIPAYFDRDSAGIPAAWIAVIKRAISTSVPAFSTRRMLIDYMDTMLAPR